MPTEILWIKKKKMALKKIGVFEQDWAKMYMMTSNS